MKITRTPKVIKAMEALTILKIPYGVPFIRRGTSFIKVKPTGFLLNSTVITDIINRGDCLIVNIITGSLFPVKGNEEIKLLEYEFKVLGQITEKDEDDDLQYK